MLVVSVKGGNIEWAIKDYKKRVQSIKQIEELRERKNFIKPSKKKRLQKEIRRQSGNSERKIRLRRRFIKNTSSDEIRDI